MELTWLKPLLDRPAPFTTVQLDATRADAAGTEEVLGRWRTLRRDLERQGAGQQVLDDLEDHIGRPTGVAGPHGRVLIADAEGVQVDRLLTAPPARSTAIFGPVPALLTVARVADESVSFVLVEVDRNGADLTWSQGTDLRGGRREVVEGGHDVVHKIREGGGWKHRRLQMRAEDSWERNADVVAADLDRQVAHRSPELVLVTGDVRSLALLTAAVGPRVRALMVEVPGGSRAEGVNEDAFVAQVREALGAYRMRRRERVLDRYRTGQGRRDAAVAGLADVVTVLRRGQVSELVLSESLSDAAAPLAERELWVGPDPLQIGLSRDELDALGVAEGAWTLRADVALLRAAIGQDAGVTFADEAVVDLVDSVGAVLRWHDGATPSDDVLSQSADAVRVRHLS